MISLKQRSQFLNQLAKSLEAGLTLSQSLRLVSGALPRSRQKSLQQVIQGIAQGQPLSATLKTEIPDFFDSWTLSLIEMGEYSGALALMCQNLAIAIEAQHHRNRILRSTTYSFALFMVGVNIIIATVFRLEESALVLLALTSGQILIVLCVAQAYPLRQKLPIFADLTRIRAMLQLAQLALPLNCGVSVLAALEFLNRHTPDPILRQILQNAAQQVKTGKPLSESLQGKIPHLVMQYVQTGEATGNLGFMFEKVMEHYDEKLKNLMHQIQTVLGPLGIIGLGTIVLALGIRLIQQITQALP